MYTDGIFLYLLKGATRSVNSETIDFSRFELNAILDINYIKYFQILKNSLVEQVMEVTFRVTS